LQLLTLNPTVALSDELVDLGESPSRGLSSPEPAKAASSAPKKPFARLKLVLSQSKTQQVSWTGLFEVALDDQFNQLRERVAKELGKPLSAVQMKFEGQVVSDDDTPRSLDIDAMSEEDKDESIQVEVYILTGSKK
jgi:hypothetical protein